MHKENVVHKANQSKWAIYITSSYKGQGSLLKTTAKYKLLEMTVPLNK